MVGGTIYDHEINDIYWTRIPGERQRDGLYGEPELPDTADVTSVRRPVNGIDIKITSDC